MNLKEQILVALGLDSNVKLEWQAKLTDGTIVVSSADELDAGVDIAVLTEDGTTMPLPVGEYETEDGVAFRVDEEGIVAELLTEETEEEAPAEEEAPEEEEVEASEDTRLPRKIKESTEVEFNADTFKTELLDEVTKIVTDLIQEALGKAKEENESLETKVEELSKEPAGKPEGISKFSSNTPRREVSKSEYRRMTTRERYQYNLNK